MSDLRTVLRINAATSLPTGLLAPPEPPPADGPISVTAPGARGSGSLALGSFTHLVAFRLGQA